MAVRIDLHTHSEASKDGGITAEQYAKLLRDETLDIIAITDHDRIDFALGMHRALGRDKIIVGQEITTAQGELVGLFLTERIKPGMSAQEAIDAIRLQGGVVYVPHPFETVRSGVSQETLDAIAQDVDIIEGYNGRAVFQNRGPQARAWAQKNGVPVAASSDAHGMRGAGTTFATIDRRPTAKTLAKQLQQATYTTQRPPLYTLLYPKINRFKNIIRRRG